ncbi:DUF1456 family protein [Pseudobdellovibrio exovorus]|uniref:DUF1456 domain-containing protein n=1 Tax=Pseudobdellovibrio exovorus JSS TaxID=1184267 RepID=M4V630_9BACT|nr:DUF1456 family protein [Pseudobdellovibrio exovorus]AGH94643.1 hypothetical protein A11Q_423 [Pseudobdellovibrio exovorus JSS]
MLNNDVLRSLRYIINVNDQKLIEIIELAGLKVPLADIQSFLKNEEDPQYSICSDVIMAHFLDGLIYYKRGKDESKPPMPFEFPISNNLVLKKLRVAFQLKEPDLHELLELADYPLGRAEMSAFLRKKDHSNYRECGDQVLRYFLKGLKIKFRGKD